MSRRVLICVSALFGLALILGASDASARHKKAATKQVRAVVLPVKVSGLETELARQLGGVMLQELRQIGVFQMLTGRRINQQVNRLRDQGVLTEECADEPGCIKKVGRVLGARVMYHMRLAAVADGVQLSMRTYDVKTGKEVRKAEEVSGEGSEELARMTRWLTRRVSSPMITATLHGKGRLEVACDEADAVLFINNKRFGKKTNKGFKVSSAAYDIRVEKPGFKPYREVVVLKPGQELIVKAKLLPDASAPMAAPVAAAAPSGKTRELPAWAAFEVPKKKPTPLQPQPQTPPIPPPVARQPEAQPESKPAPFLPPPKEDQPPERLASRDRRDSAFYQTWWFWTIVGVGLAGAGVGIALAVGGDEGTPPGPGGTGSALIVWQ